MMIYLKAQSFRRIRWKREGEHKNIEKCEVNHAMTLAER